ncbi:MAG: Coenzyme F420 hydrogenase/dehydrogenase, beta subunit C-terminal domain [Rikenellaceae bacterium]|nr:Coenzyme F420 hydrogenase/dehydrogenase, beta subunit C-terminal domain [Rikenellaceae bacterium]
MIEIKDKGECCGCSACYAICPQKCIRLTKDCEGFLYPEIKDSDCIKCGLCIKTCPVLNQNSEKIPLHCYAAKNKDLNLRKDSSSGGVFQKFAETIINTGGVVFGARFDEHWNVIHDHTDQIEELRRFRKSKYVQSELKDTFIKVRKFLSDDRKVLFVGTPCQIAGLKLFLKKDYDNLYLADFICHGVPSPEIWKLYREEVAGDAQITDIFFTDKSHGWNNSVLKINGLDRLTHKSYVILAESINKNLFMRGFLQDIFLRPSCYKCRQKMFKSHSDITLGDYWGIKAYHPEFFDDSGISLCFINTDKGEEIFKTLNLEIISTEFENAIKGNPSAVSSVELPLTRKYFFEEIYAGTNNLNKIIDKYTSSLNFRKEQIKYFSGKIGILGLIRKLT